MKLEIEYANTFLKRFKGLMFRKSIPQNFGLLISPCNQIHTFNMRFSIDVVYLDKENRVVAIDECVKPWQACKKQKKAYAVLELNAGSAQKLKISLNDIVGGTQVYE